MNHNDLNCVAVSFNEHGLSLGVTDPCSLAGILIIQSSAISVVEAAFSRSFSTISLFASMAINVCTMIMNCVVLHMEKKRTKENIKGFVFFSSIL